MIEKEKLITITPKIKENQVCPLCKGIGYVQDKKGGEVHTCFKCLSEGKL